MSATNYPALAETTVHADAGRVWKALTDPDEISQYMFGSRVSSGWEAGSDIRWKGEWKGKAYEDKGTILAIVPGSQLQYTHYSPLSGKPDEPASYHTVTITLREEDATTHISLQQDGSASEEERDHSAANWKTMLEGLKKLVEGKG